MSDRDHDANHVAPRAPIVLPPNGGRAYPMGRISAIFKADTVETGHAYSISECGSNRTRRGPVHILTQKMMCSSSSKAR
jgi:hypothetical protein